jgi:hypothetical protein
MPVSVPLRGNWVWKPRTGDVRFIQWHHKNGMLDIPGLGKAGDWNRLHPFRDGLSVCVRA